MTKSAVTYRVKFETYVKIEGCPQDGFEALDWRRTNGFSERCDNRIPVKFDGPVTEEQFRALVKAGWGATVDTDANEMIIRGAWEAVRSGDSCLPIRYQPCAGHGWRPTLRVTPSDEADPIGLMCMAARAARRAAGGADEIVTKLQEAREMVATLETQLAELE